MSLAFLFYYLMLNVFRVLIHPSLGALLLVSSNFIDRFMSPSKWGNSQIKEPFVILATLMTHPHFVQMIQQCFSYFLSSLRYFISGFAQSFEMRLTTITSDFVSLLNILRTHLLYQNLLYSHHFLVYYTLEGNNKPNKTYCNAEYMH